MDNWWLNSCVCSTTKTPHAVMLQYGGKKSPKSWNLMDYCRKNSFLQLKHYIQRIYLTLLSTTCVKNSPNYFCHFWNYQSFFTTQPLWIFWAQTLHTFYKSIPWKCRFSDFPLLALKFTKFLMSFLEPRVSFSSNFASLFSFMRHNSSVLFHLNICILWTNGSSQSAIFWTFNCSHKN